MARFSLFALAAASVAAVATAEYTYSDLDAPQQVQLGLADGNTTEHFTRVCREIEDSVSKASNFYWPGNPVFDWLNDHWASSSSEPATCVVEPTTISDIRTVLKIIGRTRTPFAVKSGVHATNVGFSSTRGVVVHMHSWRKMVYDEKAQTVELGTGVKWADVYTELVPKGVNVVGGRVNGPCVGGLILGGGYSFKSNQYGMSIDSVLAFELVRPTGEFVVVTEESDPELFYGLKGGGNNFGILTGIKMKTVPQGRVWGGNMIYKDPKNWPAVEKAISVFSNEIKDPLASIVGVFIWSKGEPFMNVIMFYDGPHRPAKIFDPFFDIPSEHNDISEASFGQLVDRSLNNDTYGQRGTFSTVPVTSYSPEFLSKVEGLTLEVADKLKDKTLDFLALVPEPFLPSLYSHDLAPNAYPYNKDKVFTPFNLFLSWKDEKYDKDHYDMVDYIVNTTYKFLLEESDSFRDILDAPLYANYARPGTPIERIYGSRLPALRKLKARVDPENIMGLAGGFKV